MLKKTGEVCDNIGSMQIVNSQLLTGKKVLLRYDIDVALRLPSVAQGKPSVAEDFKLRAGIPTLKLCLDNASQVILIGHIGRPEGRVVEELRVAPIVDWFRDQGYSADLDSGKLKILENLRFDPREEAGDKEYANELAAMGDFYVNEAFSSYRPAASTTILPTLLPHATGLRFAEEVRVLKGVREHPKKPFIAIMGGAKVEDKLPVIKVLASNADAILVGGKLVAEIREKNITLPANVLVGKLSEDGLDIASQTSQAWSSLISKAAQIVWNGPVGKFEDPKNEQSAKLAQIVIESKAELVIGGGDTVSLLGSVGLLEEYEKKGFVSVGGGAMLKLLADGTLPTIEALK